MSLRLAVSRVQALRIAPSMVRMYSPGSSDGATANSAGFRDREQAQEGQYIRRREEEALKAAREKAAKAQSELEAQQKKVDGLPKHE